MLNVQDGSALNEDGQQAQGVGGAGAAGGGNNLVSLEGLTPEQRQQIMNQISTYLEANRLSGI